MGIDLAGKVDNPTGICILNADESRGYEMDMGTLYTDEEILGKINRVQPSLIVMPHYPYQKDAAVWKRNVNVQLEVISANQNVKYVVTVQFYL